MFDAGSVPSVGPPLVVAGDAASLVAPRRGDGGNDAVAVVAKNLAGAREEVCNGVVGDHNVVAVTWPAPADGDRTAGVAGR